jgi:hypothetical protein
MCACHNLLISAFVDAQPILGFEALQGQNPLASRKLTRQRRNAFCLLKRWLWAESFRLARLPSPTATGFSCLTGGSSQSAKSSSLPATGFSCLTGESSQSAKSSLLPTTGFSCLTGESSQSAKSSSLPATGFSCLTGESSQSAKSSSLSTTVSSCLIGDSSQSAESSSVATIGPESASLGELVRSACPVCGLLARKVCHGCGEKFCHAHVYDCLECDTPLCGACMDDHSAEGHWSDSDTAREMSSARSGSGSGPLSGGGGR